MTTDVAGHGRAFIGTSGWTYRHWRGPVYPREVPPREWLQFYARHFESVELNTSFYRLPRTSMFAAWAAGAPGGFVFAVKASRYLTHVKRLIRPGPPLRRLLARARRLRGHLGPVLVQLPERFHVDLVRLDGFLDAVARQRLVPGLRVTLEVRHPSWLTTEVMARLTAHRVALCLTDFHTLPVAGPLTADFVYVRRHGTRAGYAGQYGERMLRADARRVRRWRDEGRDVYVYYNNDARGAAFADAARLVTLVSGRRSERSWQSA